MLRLSHGKSALAAFAFCLLSSGLFLQAGCAWHRTSSAPPEIHTVSQLRRLKFDALRSQVFVRIRGFITASDPLWNVMILQDEAGQGVRLDATDFNVPINQLVEVTGFAVAGGNNPTIAKPLVRWISNQAPPEGKRVRLEELLDPKRQYTKVQIDSVVRDSVSDRNDRIAGLMRVGDTVVKLRVLDDPSGVDVTGIIDDEVHISGVIETSYGVFGEPSRAVLWVDQKIAITKRTSAPEIADLPVSSVREVKAVLPLQVASHRLRLRGEVYTDSSGSNLFLKDPTGVLPLQLAASAALVTGANLDAIGYIHLDGNGYHLENVTVARLIAPHGSARALAPLTRVDRIHALSPEEASRAYPVHLQGVVTFIDPAYGMLFVQDSTGGIYVAIHLPKGTPVKPKDLADVTGTTQAGFFAPEVGHPTVRVIGTAPLPAVTPPNSEDFYTGREDSDWVRARGVVQSVTRESGHTTLSLASGVHRFRVETPSDAPWADSLINSEISVDGVSGSNFNTRKQLMGITVWIQGRDQIRMLTPATNPAKLPFTPIAQLLQYSPSFNPDRPVRVHGVVTSSMPQGPTYIQDSTGAVVISNHRQIALQKGDLVTALGFAHFAGFTPALQEAVLAKVTSGIPLVPVRLTADEAFEGDYDAQLIQIDAVLLDRVTNQAGETLMLQAGRTLLNATGEIGVRLGHFQSGAVLRVTGVCFVQYGTLRGAPVSKALNVILRSADDVKLLRPEPWWTLPHAFELIGLLASVACLAGLWGLVLRRRVHQQTRVISEKLAQEENLKLAAQQASRAKSEFLAVMSHEIRTPMNGVLGMTSLLLTTPLDDEQLDFVNTIRSSGDALMTIINDILDFSKIEAGKLAFEQLPFSLPSLIRESVGVVAVAAHEKRLTLTAFLDDKLQPSLMGDPSRLRQIILNLLSNAVKFTQEGSVTLSVKKEHLDGHSQTFLVSVKDTGIGISPDQQSRLFQSFSQGDTSTTRKFGGTGLGLAITKRLIEQMGGSLGLESEVGVGSTFWFQLTLPVQPHASEAATSVPEELLLSA